MNLATPSIDAQRLLEGAFACHQAGDLSSAQEGYTQILACIPDHVDALQLSGLLARQQERFDDAILLINQAIKLNPEFAVFHHNLAETYHALENLDEAEACYRRAVQLAPEYVEPKINLGVILQDRADLLAAIDIFKSVVALQPDHLLGQYNLASCYRTLGDFEFAYIHCLTCLQLDPTCVDARHMMAELQLSKGNFEDGWVSYEWRRYLPSHKAKIHHRLAPFPRWEGSSLKNKRILLQAEQGLGDEIMFSSCVSEVSAVAGDVLLECDLRLVPLFSRSFPDVKVLPTSPENNSSAFLDNGSIDWRLPVGSLPAVYRKSITDFRSRGAYLFTDHDLRLVWRKRLAKLRGRLKVGISWRGGRGPAEQLTRSVPLSLLAVMFEMPGVDFVNLQYGDHNGEIKTFNAQVASPLVSFPEYDPLLDLDSAAALMAELDLIITIDNTTAHLAGALGIPVWNLLPCDSNWRWLRGEVSSYWYESMRLFQQKSFGDTAWVNVIDRVADSLRDRLSAPSFENSVERQTVDASLISTATGNFMEGSPSLGSRVLLLNDTASWYHWGCSCTSIAIHHQLNEMRFSVSSMPINAVMAMSSLPQSVDDFDSEDFWKSFKAQQEDVLTAIGQADLLVVNGEGSLHGLGPLPLKLLYLMYIARTRLGVPVQLINHSCYPEDGQGTPAGLADFIYKKVYETLDFCGVREITSAQVLKQLGIPATITFDCMPLFIERNYSRKEASEQKSIVIAGSVALSDTALNLIASCLQKLAREGYEINVLIGADAYPAEDDLNFVTALSQRCPQAFKVINAESEAEWLSTIDQAHLLISGRFHHSIAAVLLQTPFIALETNTPKLDALLKLLSLPWRVSVEDMDAEERLIQMAEALLASPEKGCVSEAVRLELKVLSLKNFVGLGKVAEKIKIF